MSKVSVIVPVYKVEQYLDKCLESIVKQTYKNLEVLVIDDCSPDSCPLKCDQWAKKDERIKVIHKQQNGGLVRAWKTGTTAASGEYVVYIDGDDYVECEYVEKLLNAIKTSSSDIAVCDYFESRDGEMLHKTQYNQEQVFRQSKKFNCVELFAKPYNLQHCRWNKMYKRELLLQCLDYVDSNATMGEDLNLTFLTMYKAKSVCYINQPLYVYRILESSMSRVIKNGWPSYKLVINKLADFLKLNKPSKKVKRVFISYIFLFFDYTLDFFRFYKREEEIPNLIFDDCFVSNYLKEKPLSKRHFIFYWLYKLKMKKLLVKLLSKQ